MHPTVENPCNNGRCLLISQWEQLDELGKCIVSLVSSYFPTNIGFGLATVNMPLKKFMVVVHFAVDYALYS